MTSLSQTSKNISRKVTEIENFVKKRLLNFYNSEIKPLATLMPAESLRRIHEDRVKVMIRKAIQEGYLAGIEIVGDKINEKISFETFISQSDIGNIVNLTDELNDSFWQTVSRLVQRENEFVVEDNELIQKPSFDTEAAITGIASLIAYQSFNNAILSKMNDLPFGNLNYTIPPPVPPPDQFATDFLPEDFPTEEFILDLTQLHGKIKFVTKEDEKVDPEICAPLADTEYEVNDPTIPLPPLHRYCRCRLIPVIQEEITVTPAITGTQGSPF